KDDSEITELIASFMNEPRFPIRMASINGLGWRGDASAIPALEAMLRKDDLTIEMVPMIKRNIAKLRGGGTKAGTHAGEQEASAGNASATKPEVDRLERLEKLVHEMNERLKAIESKLSAK